MSRSDALPTAAAGVILGRFDRDQVRAGALRSAIMDDERLELLGIDVDIAAIETACISARVAVLDGAEGRTYTAVRRIKRLRPALGIVVFAHRPSLECRRRLFLDGATCLWGEATPAQISDAIWRTAHGETEFWRPDCQGFPTCDVARLETLTNREAEVYELLRRGSSYTEIGKDLAISAVTARWHSRRAMEKLGAANRWDVIGRPSLATYQTAHAGT